VLKYTIAKFDINQFTQKNILDFDVVFKHLGDRIDLTPVVTSGETALTITSWIKLANATNNFTLYQAGTTSSDIEIAYRNEFFIIVNGYVFISPYKTKILSHTSLNL
jgi:hypothetical protein